MAYFDKYGVEYSDDRKTLVKCPKDYEGEYIIPNSVINIKQGAFQYCIGLTSITIPDSVSSIEHGTFWGCFQLNSIEIPDSITSIGSWAFKGCKSLTSISFADSLSSIGEHAFEDCTSLHSINIPESVNRIKSCTFKNCHSLTSIEIPYDVCSIENFAFEGSGLTSINVVAKNPYYYSDDGILYHRSDDCISLKAFPPGKRGSLTITKQISAIAEGALSGCVFLSHINVLADHPEFCSIDGVLFNKDKTTLVAYPAGGKDIYSIPEGVTTIGPSAFRGCRKLKSIDISSSVIKIRGHAFEDCTSLTSLNIPDNVAVISSHAFSGCLSLTICIPLFVKFDIPYIDEGEGAFAGVANIIYKGEISPKIRCEFGYECRAINGFEEGDFIYSDTSKMELSVCLPRAKGEITIPEGVKIIRNFSFWGCDKISKINLPHSLQSICSNNELLQCNNLKEVIVPIGHEERFCKMPALEKWAKAIRKSAIIRKREEYEQRLLQEQQRQKLFQDSNLFFDTETTGLPPKGMYNASPTCTDIWPRMVQLAWIVTNQEGKILKRRSEIIYPDGFTIPQEATDVHGITTERARREGKPLREVLDDFAKDLVNAKQIVCHNVEFDQHIVGAELYRMDMDYQALMDKPSICTMLSSTNFCAIPNPNGYDDYKWPKLSELYRKLFNRDFEDAHDALADITATKDCFFELKRRGII